MNKKRTKNKSKGSKKLRTLLDNLVGPDGQPVGILGIKRVIAEHKRAEEALRESEERYRHIFEQSPIGIGISSTDGKVITGNKAMQTITGYSIEELKKINLADTYENEEDRKALIETISRYGRVVDYPVRLKRKDGTPYDALLTISRINLEGKDVYHTICQDISERRKAEKELKRLSSVVDAMVDGVTITDLYGKITYINRAVTEQLGYEKEELIGKTPTEFIAKKDKSKFAAEAKKVLLGKSTPKSSDYLVKRKDGTEIPISVNFSILRDPKGRPREIIAVNRNMTERKQAEETLMESEEKFRLAFENAKDAILWADPETGLIANCNKAAEILLEKKRGEIVGYHQTTIHPPQKAEYYANMFEKHIEQEGAADDEAEVITNSGKIKTVHITASVTLVGGKPIIQGIFRDITERKRAEEALRIKDSAIASSINAIALADLEGNLTYVNPSFLKMWGYDNEKEVLGKSAVEFWLEGEKASKVIEVLRDRGSWAGELVAMRKDGSLFHVELMASAVTDETGKPICLMGSFINITERKRAYSKIKVEREAYQSIACAANQSRSVEELCELALKGIRTAIKYDMADVMVYREADNTLFSATQVGYPEDLYQRTIKRQDLKGESRVAAQAARKRKSIYIDDMKTNKLTSYVRDLIVKYDISTLYVVPLFNRGKLQGVLEVLTTGDRKLSKNDREVLDTISEELAGGIAKAKIEERLVTVKEAFGWIARG